jgi:hypothetical protein
MQDFCESVEALIEVIKCSNEFHMESLVIYTNADMRYYLEKLILNDIALNRMLEYCLDEKGDFNQKRLIVRCLFQARSSLAQDLLLVNKNFS